MADVKTQKLSYPEWCDLLEPYGWANITMRSPVFPGGGPALVFEWDVSLMLQASPGNELGEWAERSYLLEQARLAVQAVRDAGYRLHDPPGIEFGGRYMYRIGSQEPASWAAEATLRFSVHEL
jgi:hypothetical protein